MSRIQKSLGAALLVAVLSLSLVSPAFAFDGRGGDKVVIPADETINDDLYAGANEITIDGTVNGDAIVFGNMVTVNGTVNGDLLTAAQTVVVNGTVTGDVRMAGSVLFVGEKAKIGGDLLGAGYSLEVRKAAAVGRDAVFATGQTLLAADVERNVVAYSGGLELAGNVGGNVKAEVGEAAEGSSGPPPTMFMGQSTVPVPVVAQGLTIDPAAKISGKLEYTQDVDLAIPAGVVVGTVTRVPQPEDERETRHEETTQEKVASWALRTGRSLVSLLLVGLLLLWLFPIFTGAISVMIEKKPWRSLGWGVISYAAFFFALLVILFVTTLGAVLFGILTLGGLSAAVVFLGLLAIFIVVLGFVLTTAFVAKIAFGMTLGRWLLQRLHSPLAEHRYWPMVIGVIVIVTVVALLSFPLIPGALGWLLNLAIILFGLGALWLWGQDAWMQRRGPAAS